MIDFDKFEKLAKEKLSEQEFQFDEANWEKASKMIDASRQGKNRGGIFFLSAIALLLTTGLVYYFGFSDSGQSLKNNNLAVNGLKQSTEGGSLPETNSSAPNPATEETIKDATANTAVSENNSTENNISNSASSDQLNTTASTLKNKTSNAGGFVKGNVDVKQTERTNSESKPVTEENNNIANTESKSETKADPTTSAGNTNSEKASESNAAAKSDKKSETQITQQNRKTTPPKIGLKTSNTNSSANNSSKGANTTPNNGETNNSNKEGNLNTNPGNNTVNNGNGTAVNDSIEAVVTVGVKPGENAIADTITSIAQIPADSLMPKPGSVPPATTGDGISYATNVKLEHEPKSFLYAEVGASYLLGWSGEAGGFNPVAGINFQHYFTNVISAQVGIQYSTISNLTNTTHTISTVKYDFGMEQDVTTIKYQKLHYLVAPIKLSYTIKKNNIISLGCNVGYLLNSESKKEKYKTYSNDPGAAKNNLTSSKEMGYVQGFNPYDIQVSAAYRRKIYKGFSANAEFIYGLTDTKNNSSFKSNNFDRNVGFKLTLCYDLFKK